MLTMGALYDPTVLTIYLSFSRKYRNQNVENLAISLKNFGKFNVWYSPEEPQIDKALEAIDVADVVIICLSNCYNESDLCKAEAKFADDRKKPVIFLQIEPDFRPIDWLSGSRAAINYYDDNGTPIELVTSQLTPLFDANNSKKFRTIGITVPRFNKQCYRKLNFKSKLDEIAKICEKGGMLVITGDDGVGKTYFMSLLLLQPKCRSFLLENCQIGTALWLNCYPWHDEILFEKNGAMKEELKAEMLKLLATATKRGNTIGLSFDEHVAVLTEILQAPPIFIFDDVFHFPLLAFLREQCKNLPCIVITSTKYSDLMQIRTRSQQNEEGTNVAPWQEIVTTLTHIDPMTNDEIFEMLSTTFGMKKLMKKNDRELKSLADSCKGMPREAAKIAMRMQETNLPTSPTSPRGVFENKFAEGVLRRFESSVQNQSETTANSRPDATSEMHREQDAIRKCIKALCLRPWKSFADDGFLVVEGPAGIGKTTLLSNVLHDPWQNAYFQQECDFQIVLWLNCYQWRDGFDGKNKQEETHFLNKLLSMGSKADNGNETGFTSLTEMCEHFYQKSPKLRILFVLDDVLHYSILQTFRNECKFPFFLCIVITRDSFSVRKRGFDPFVKLPGNVSNPYQVSPLSQDRVDEMLRVDYRLKGKISDQQLSNLAKRSLGVPLNVNLIGGFLKDCPNYEACYKTISNKKTNRGEAATCQLIENSWESLFPAIRHYYYIFLLFNPGEEILEECLLSLWNCKNLDQVGEICMPLERLGFLNKTNRFNCNYYSVHQILHESAVVMAINEYQIEEAKFANASILGLSDVRICLLRNLTLDEGKTSRSAIRKILASLRRLNDWHDYLLEVVRKIDTFPVPVLDSESDNQGLETILQAASQCGHYNLVKYLVSIGVNFDVQDESGKTALMRAVSEGCEKIVEFLLSQGVRFDLADSNWETALMKASRKGFRKIVDLLIAVGSDLNWANERGETALMKAALFGRSEIVHVLLAKGGIVHMRDVKGMRCLMKAALAGHCKAVEVILGKDEQIDATDIDGETALMKAAERGHFQTVELLLSQSAKIDLEDKAGETALIKAERNDHWKVVQVIVKFNKSE